MGNPSKNYLSHFCHSITLAGAREWHALALLAPECFESHGYNEPGASHSCRYGILHFHLQGQSSRLVQRALPSHSAAQRRV